MVSGQADSRTEKITKTIFESMTVGVDRLGLCELDFKRKEIPSILSRYKKRVLKEQMRL